MRHLRHTFAMAFASLCVQSPAHAIRPFVTDDARVVGKGLLQVETYWRRDEMSAQHWILPAMGPTDWLELSLGAVHGVAGLPSPERRYALGGPLLQGKFLLRETVPNRFPGIAIATGVLPPLGRGGFEAPGWGAFSYLAVTQALLKEDDWLIHGNVGVTAVAARDHKPFKVTWGFGTQVETVFNVHLIAEVFSGDPYVQAAGGACQLGFRIIFNDNLQLDGTWGRGAWGDAQMPFWFSSGIRWVSPRLF